LCERQAPDFLVRSDRREAIAREQFQRPFPERPGTHRAEPRQSLATEPDVLLDRQIGDERELLKDRGDSGSLGGAGIGGFEGLAREEDLALVGPDRAGKDLDEGALARTVLAKQRVDFAGLGVELGARERA